MNESGIGKKRKVNILSFVYLLISLVGILFFCSVINLKAKAISQEEYAKDIVNSYPCVVKTSIFNEQGTLLGDGTYSYQPNKSRTVTFDIPELNMENVSLLADANVGDIIEVTMFEKTYENRVYLTSSLNNPKSGYFAEDYDRYMSDKQDDMNWLSILVRAITSILFVLLLLVPYNMIKYKILKSSK